MTQKIVHLPFQIAFRLTIQTFESESNFSTNGEDTIQSHIESLWI